MVASKYILVCIKGDAEGMPGKRETWEAKASVNVCAQRERRPCTRSRPCPMESQSFVLEENSQLLLLLGKQQWGSSAKCSLGPKGDKPQALQ